MSTTRILYPEWPAENSKTKYPFAARATLTNGAVQLLIGTFLDAVLFPIGGHERLRLSKVIVTHANVTLYIGDQITEELASGTFNLPVPPDNVSLADTYGRPAGFIISDSQHLGLFPSWGVGTYKFTADATEFAATVCIPTPEAGVRGFLLDDGTLLTGDVWLIGDAGVALSADSSSGQPVIRVDVVGDPLFLRQQCVVDAAKPHADDQHEWQGEEQGEVAAVIISAKRHEEAAGACAVPRLCSPRRALSAL